MTDFDVVVIGAGNAGLTAAVSTFIIDGRDYVAQKNMESMAPPCHTMVACGYIAC